MVECGRRTLPDTTFTTPQDKSMCYVNTLRSTQRARQLCTSSNSALVPFTVVLSLPCRVALRIEQLACETLDLDAHG